jgi:hypothetical protein
MSRSFMVRSGARCLHLLQLVSALAPSAGLQLLQRAPLLLQLGRRCPPTSRADPPVRVVNQRAARALVLGQLKIHTNAQSGSSSPVLPAQASPRRCPSSSSGSNSRGCAA